MIRPRLALVWIALAALARPVQALTPPIDGPLPEAALRALRAGVLGPVARADAAAVPGRPRPLSALTSRQQRILDVPVDFPDQPFTFSSDTLHWLLFAHRSTGPGTGSARDYFEQASLGAYELEGDVLPWRHLTHPKDYYANGQYGFGLAPQGRNAAGLVREVVQQIDTLVDWTRYDLDGDGYVDVVWVTHSGVGAESNTKDGTNMWSHESQLSSWGPPGAYVTHSPWPGHPGQYIKVDKYTLTPEISAQHPGQLNEIGPFCHEHGHTLGLPDLYNTTSATFSGVGNWDLMAGGVYGGDGQNADSPTLPGAWSRAYLGWLPPAVVSTEGPVTLPPVETTPGTLKLWSEGRPDYEYDLLEDRQPTGWDRWLPGGGLLVWHIDERVIQNGLPYNTVDQGIPFGVAVVEADGASDLAQGVNRGDAGDVYPGSTRNYTLDDASVPASLDNAGGDPHVSIRGVRQNVDQSVSAWLSYSPDRWNPPMTVSGPSGSVGLTAGSGRSVAVDALGSLHLAWSDDSHGSTHVFYLERRNGLEWAGTPRQLDAADIAYSASIQADPRGDLLAVWQQISGGHAQLAACHRRAGSDWDTPVILRNGVPITSPPTLCATSTGHFYCAWAERDSTSRDHVKYITYVEGTGWAGGVSKIGDDSTTSQPVLATDTNDHVHLAYIRLTSGFRNVMHMFYPTNLGTWSSPFGPLAFGAAVTQPMLAAVDSGRVALAWRDPRGGAHEIYFCRFDRDAWGAPQGPAATVPASQWPVTMIGDPATERLLFLWEADGTQQTSVAYREAGFRGAWDSNDHTLAVLDSSGAAQPGGMLTPDGGMLGVWLSGSTLHVRTRQGPVLGVSPPNIVPLPPDSPHLAQNRPNPVQGGSTHIDFVVPGAVTAAGARPGVPAAPGADPRVRLQLFDVTGRRVRVLADGALAAGRHTLVWDGRLEGGRRAPAGIYFYRLELGAGRVETRKLLLLH